MKLISILIHLILCLTVTIKAQEEKPGFIATFPSSVLPKSTAKFCIRFQNLNSDVNVVVEENEPFIFDHNPPLRFEVLKSTPEYCTDIHINDELKEYKEKKITVSGEAIDGSYRFNDTKSFAYKLNNYFVTVETDKPVYKPGDKVRIRILTLDYALKPLANYLSYLVYVIDSSNSRVNQWENVISKNGLISLEMALSEEPNLGKWSIEVIKQNENVATHKTFFEVKKYVLPKFEVYLNHKKELRINEKSATVSVCAKYSFGKSVLGTFTLNAYTKRYSVKTYREEIFSPILKTEKGKGCVDFSFQLSDLGIEKNMYFGKIYLEGTVVELDTSIKANSSSSFGIVYKSLNIELLEPYYYKPNMPINFILSITSVDGEEIKNRNIKLQFEKDGIAFYEKSSIINANNLVEFKFNPEEDMKDKSNDFFRTDTPSPFYLKVIVDDKKIESNDLPYASYMYDSQRSFNIEPWFSTKNGYLQIYKQTHDALECDEEIISKVLLRSPKKSYGNVYFQLQARSNVLISGHYDSVTNQTVVNGENGKFSIVKIDIDKRCKSAIHATDSSKKGLKLRKQSENEFYVYDSSNDRCIISTSLSNQFNSLEACEKACKKAANEKQVSSVEIYEDTFEIKFNARSDMSPESKLILFYINDGEIVPDSVSYRLNKCLSNKVHLTLDRNAAQVGQKIAISLRSEPNSICALSAIDKSVTFMGKRNTIDFETIFNKLAEFELSYDNENQYLNSQSDCEIKNNWPPIMPRPLPVPIPLRKRRSFIYPYRLSHFYDSTKAFRESRLVYLSDYGIYQECPYSHPYFFAMPRSGMRKTNNIGIASMEYIQMDSTLSEPAVASSINMNHVHESAPQPVETIRTYFPETWVWSIDLTNEQGKIDMKERAPDSITDWIFDAYCLSDKNGTGIAKTQVLKVFQPLFVSINMPYSVIRGEQFQVKASVFSFDDTCIPMQIEIIPEKRLFIKKNEIKLYKECLCPDEKITVSFNLQALDFDIEKGLNLTVRTKTLNETNLCGLNQPVKKIFKFTDSETKTIIVEPEGIPREHTESIFVVFKENQKLSNQSFKLELPKNIVPKSSRVFLKITGDVNGPLLNNLDNLVSQPTGCGEQNMVKFAPIISVVDYLKQTFQLTEKMSELTKNYLKIGYQRQLTYRHKDGSFSAFGPNYSKESGGTWLTAFVLRCFADAYKLNHIKLDENDILLSAKMLLDIQNKEDGSFPQVGVPLLSKAMAGGLKDFKIGLSAYVMISLLKVRDSVKLNDENSLEKINKGLEYLKTHAEQKLEESDTYTIALINYALKLDTNEENDDIIEKLDQELNKRAILQDGFKYWKEDNKVEEDTSNIYNNPSADLEITSYVLLSRLINSKPEDLAEISSTAKWINSQRNSLGGFYSTQDTVIALDALSKFSSVFYSQYVSLKVSYDFSSSKNTLFINDRNRLLVQQIKLNNFREAGLNSLVFDIEGYGTGLIQVIMKYSIEEQDRRLIKNDFELSLSSTETSCKNADLSIKARYVGNKEASSMAIISVRLPTGWLPDEESIIALKETKDLKRHELNENKIFLYFDNLDKTEKNFKIKVFKKFNINSTRPGHVSVYDYYEPLNESVVHQFEITEKCNN